MVVRSRSWCFHGASCAFMTWRFHGPFTVFRGLSRCLMASMVRPWCFHGAFMLVHVLSWWCMRFHGATVGLPWTFMSLSWWGVRFHDAFMVVYALSRCIHGVCMVFPRYIGGAFMLSLSFLYGAPVVFPWNVYRPLHDTFYECTIQYERTMKAPLYKVRTFIYFLGRSPQRAVQLDPLYSAQRE